jgi:Tol biopolymer transport system component
MGATGESARKVSELGFTPSWSPDGREIAVAEVRTDAPWSIAGTSSIWAVRLDSGERRVVSRALGLSPSWSPDGRRIAFWDLSEKGYQRDLWTVAADGSQAEPAQAVPVTDDAPLDWNPVWTPAGDALVFGSTRSGAFNLWRIALDPSTGAPRSSPEPLTVPSGWAGWPSLSRDGRRLAFVDRNARSTVVRSAFDPVARKLAGAAAPAFQSSLELLEQELSPDGAWILFSNAGLPANLHVVRADGTGYRQVIDGDFRDRQAHWSPDGRTIAFQTSRWDSGLALVHADGSGLRQVPSGPEPIWEPRWSPDGTRLAVNGNDHFLIVDLQTTPPTPHEQPLPGEDQTFLPCSWSRDGETILGSVLHRGELLHYGTFSTRDGTYRRIELRAPAGGGLRFGGDFQSHYPTLLPDGKSFLFADGEQLLLGDLAGGPVQEIYRAAPQHRLERPTLSHDGRWLTVLDLADESDIWLATFEPTNDPDRAEEEP